MQMGTIITLWESRTRAKNSEKSNLELNYGLSFWTKWTQSERVRCIAVVYTRKCMCSLFACCHHVYSLFPIAKRRTENEFTATEHTNDFLFCIVWSPYKRWSTRNERDFFDFDADICSKCDASRAIKRYIDFQMLSMRLKCRSSKCSSM